MFKVLRVFGFVIFIFDFNCLSEWALTAADDGNNWVDMKQIAQLLHDTGYS